MENLKSDGMCVFYDSIKKKNKGRRELCFDFYVVSKQGDTLSTK